LGTATVLVRFIVVGGDVGFCGFEDIVDSGEEMIPLAG
jgi:hypothetical protein